MASKSSAVAACVDSVWPTWGGSPTQSRLPLNSPNARGTSASGAGRGSSAPEVTATMRKGKEEAFRLGQLALQAKLRACKGLDIENDNEIIDIDSDLDAARLFKQHKNWLIMDIVVIYAAANVGTQDRTSFQKRMWELFPFEWPDNTFQSKVYQSFHKAIRDKGIPSWHFKNRGQRGGHPNILRALSPSVDRSIFRLVL